MHLIYINSIPISLLIGIVSGFVSAIIYYIFLRIIKPKILISDVITKHEISVKHKINDPITNEKIRFCRI